MNRLFAVKPLLVVTAALAIALVLACGGRGDPTSPGSLLRLLPQNADSFTFADLEQLRDERLNNLEQQLASLIGEGRLDDWGIDLDDASSLVLSDPDSRDALIILRGRFVAEDVEDALDDDGLRDSVHRDVTVWSERRGGVALAFVGEDVIVIGEEERVEDSIDVFIDEARSMEQDDEAEAIVDALEDALVYSVAEDCGYRACRRQGSAVRVEARDLVAVFAFLFRNDDAAADAEGDIADDLEDLVDDPRTETDGEMVIAESPVDEDQLGLDRNGALAYRLEGDGSTPGRGGEERPAPAPERPRLGDDHGDDRSGATRIRDGEFLDGDIERDGDRDFFFFSAEGGREYRIETHLGVDTVLVLYGPDGDYLVEDDDSGDSGASRLEWVAPSSDTYYIEVSGFSDTLGTYQLSLSVLGAQPLDDHGDDRSGATRIRDGEFLDGDIERDGDRDFFFFSAEGGREYRIETHLGFDTVLVLYGPDGDYLVEDDDSGDSGASRLEWVAPLSDTYYIEVSGFSDTLGTYQLSLSVLGAQPPDDHGDDRSGATRIRDGEFLDGDIELDGDRDFFFFSAERGREYRIETHLGADTVLVLYGPDGDYLVEDDDSGGSGASRLEWVAPSSDTYYIEVSGFSDTLGTYQLSLFVLGAQPPDDHGDDRSGATRIRDGEFLDGDIERDGDRDFFFFSAEGGREYRIETHLGVDTVLVLYGPDGDYLVEDDDSGEDGASLLEWVAPSSDTYYIEVSGFDGTPGTYQLSLSVLGTQPPDDHGDDRSGATRIRDGEFLDGDIELDGDRDFFFFSAERGREYRIETHLGADTVLVLYGPDGDYLVEDDDSGGSGASRLEWVAPSSDTYYIEVSGFSDTLGTYQLSLSVLGAQPPDDHGDDRSGATRIRDGEFLDGDIERDGDRDFFFFSAEGGREYRIETHLGVDTVLVLYGPDGDYLVEDDDSGDSGASRLEWVAPSSDTYYIEVLGFESTTGTYHLSLSVLGAQPPDDHGDDRSGATRIRDGEFLDGDIERDGDRDFFFFSAERGREYRIETHLGFDTVLVLYGPDGDYLVEDDDSGDSVASLLEWVAPSSDTYYIEVSGFESTTGTYHLSLSDLGTQPPDDHGDDLSGATRIRDGEFLSGDIELDGDRDFFFFSAERGREYRIKTHLGFDTVLVLYGPDGDYLDEDDDSGDSGASRLEWVAPSSDTYYIEVSGFESTTGTYQLSLLELGRPATEVNAIGPGETVEGRIGDEEDRGYFEFSAQRGREYVIETHLGSLSDTVLVLTGPGGLRLEDDDSGDGAASRMYWTAPESDEYLIEVKGFGGATGSYALSLTELERDPTLTPPRRDARYGGELVLALAEEPFEDGFSPRDNFSAGASQIYSLIFSRLWRVSPDSTGGVELDLVEWWEVSEDGRTWTVGLRQDARFHDGRRVTARDAEYSIEAFSLVDFAGVSVIDDYTLRIEFEEPNIGFVNTMASSWRAIVVPRGLLDAPIGRFTDLVGSGPFVPAEHNRNSVSTVGRNPDYYEDGLPFLDTVSLYVAPERTTRYAAFQAGEFHFLGYPYSRTSSGHFPPLTNQEHARVSRNAAFGTYPVVFALWFDTRDLPFSDPRVRLAVNRVIDRNALDSLWAAGEPQGPVPEALFPAWRIRLDAPREGPRELDEWNRYDPEMARGLLAEASYHDGFATSIQVPPNPPQTWRDLAASISDMLADVAIYADVVESDFNAPAERGIKLSPVGRFGQDIDRFFIEHFGSGGEYNYSHTRLDPPDLNSIIGLHQELVEQVYYIPLPALLYARSESVRGPLWAELYDLGTTLRHVWLER